MCHCIRMFWLKITENSDSTGLNGEENLPYSEFQKKEFQQCHQRPRLFPAHCVTWTSGCHRRMSDATVIQTSNQIVQSPAEG